MQRVWLASLRYTPITTLHIFMRTRECIHQPLCGLFLLSMQGLPILDRARCLDGEEQMMVALEHSGYLLKTTIWYWDKETCH